MQKPQEKVNTSKPPFYLLKIIFRYYSGSLGDKNEGTLFLYDVIHGCLALKN